METKIKKAKINNNRKYPATLKIIHWNANSIWNKSVELEMMLRKYDPDIVTINETKLSMTQANFISKNNDYNYLFKCRKQSKGGAGGVATLVKKIYIAEEIDVQTEDEILFIKVTIGCEEYHMMNYYCPPQKDINKDVILKNAGLHKNFILCGDFNAKSINLGNNSQNSNGSIMEEILSSSNLIVANTEGHTFHRTWNNYKEKLDLVICNPKMANLLHSYRVLYAQDFGSDHIPILCNFTIKTEPGDKLNTGNKPVVFYKKMFDNTNWESYRSYLDANINVDGINSLEELNSYVCKIIQQADEKTIPVRKIIQGRKALPSYLVDMIKYRRKLRRNLNKSDRVLKNIEMYFLKINVFIKFYRYFF